MDLNTGDGLTLCSSISDSSHTNTNTHRSHRHGIQTKRSQAGWTDEEDIMLTQQVNKYNERNWKKIAESLPGRSVAQCMSRWKRVLNPDLVKGVWTKQEDDFIRELIEKDGCKKWSLIAKHVPGRIGKQCQERWHNHLDPAIKNVAWTDDEESSLAYYHLMYGNRWTKIARFLPGRTDNAIKNHWRVLTGTKRSLMPPTKKRNLRTPLLEQNTCSTVLAVGNGLGFTRYSNVKEVEQSTSQGFNRATSFDDSFLSLSLSGFVESSSKTSENQLVSKTPTYGSVCYEPPNISNSCWHSDGHVSCSASVDLALSISSCSSLRSSCKNTITSRKTVGHFNSSEVQKEKNCDSQVQTLGYIDLNHLY